MQDDYNRLDDLRVVGRRIFKILFCLKNSEPECHSVRIIRMDLHSVRSHLLDGLTGINRNR